ELGRWLGLAQSCELCGAGRSPTKVGWTAVASESRAVLPAGVLVKAQANSNGSPSTSLEPLPSRRTVAPTRTVCAGPALATGAESAGRAAGRDGARRGRVARTTS